MNYGIIDRFIGRELKDARERMGLSLRDVEERIGVTRSSVSLYERGKISVPIDVYMRMCEVYGIDFRQLMIEAQEYFIEQIKRADFSAEQDEPRFVKSDF